MLAYILCGTFIISSLSVILLRTHALIFIYIGYKLNCNERLSSISGSNLPFLARGLERPVNRILIPSIVTTYCHDLPI